MMKNDVFPWFQPIIETSSGRVVGYEALARTLDREGRVVSAGALFRNSRLSVEERLEIDREVRFKALMKLGELPGDTYLSINLSPEWLKFVAEHEQLPTLNMLKAVGGDPSRVVIEITELDGDIELIERAVCLYRNAGFRIAIDDFGAGFSQLDRVARLMPDIIKLDMKLLHDGLDCARNASMIQLLGGMASKLGAQVLCEGVETEEAYFLALSCNASYTQGFLFSQAVAEPDDPECFITQQAALLARYRDMAIDGTARNHWMAEKISAELIALRELIKASDNNLALENYVPTSRLLRFYICDRDGNQISPNYESRAGAWVADERTQGLNWSWRPYFFELLGADDIGSRLVFSEPYHDIHASQLSQTAALLIDDERILLADLLSKNGDRLRFPSSKGMAARSVTGGT